METVETKAASKVDEEGMIVGGVLITDPEALKHVRGILAKQEEPKAVRQIAHAAWVILKRKGITLNGRRLLITTSDEGFRAELAEVKGHTSGTKVGAYPTNVPKPTRIVDPEGGAHDFGSNHQSFLWVASTYEVEVDPNIKHNYMGTLQRMGIIEPQGFVDGIDTYKVK